MSAYFHEWICEMKLEQVKCHIGYSRELAATISTSERDKASTAANEREEEVNSTTRKEYREFISSKIASIASEMMI